MAGTSLCTPRRTPCPVFPRRHSLVDQGPTPRPLLPFRIAGLRPQQIPISGFLGACPNTPYSLFCSNEMGCGRDIYLGKRAASRRDDGGAPGPATASALHPLLPLLYGISQALTCRDPGQFLFRLLSSAAGPPALRVIGSWYSDGNNDQDKKDFCTRQLLVT